MHRVLNGSTADCAQQLGWCNYGQKNKGGHAAAAAFWIEILQADTYSSAQ